jgi:hypothetical protein
MTQIIVLGHFDVQILLVGEERDDSSRSEDHYKRVIDSLEHYGFYCEEAVLV